MYRQIITQLMLILCTSCLYRPLGPPSSPRPRCSEFEADFFCLPFTWMLLSLQRESPGSELSPPPSLQEQGGLSQGQLGKALSGALTYFLRIFGNEQLPLYQSSWNVSRSVTSALRAGDCCSGRGRRSPAGMGMAAHPLQATPIQFVHAMRWPACPISMSYKYQL